jgi:mannitol/fructose-specific phosphotransferase system IIA component (Ntr-type)
VSGEPDKKLISMSPETLIQSTTAMTLADFTSPGLIVPHLRGQDTAMVIQELSQAMRREQRVPDLLPFYHAALNREFLVVSDWEEGMAFPHARLPGLKQVFFALGRSDESLSWVGKAVHSVRLVFLIAVPATDSTQYLSLISGLARLAKNERLVNRLHGARDTFEIIEVLKQIELRTTPSSDLFNSGLSAAI